MAHRNQLKAKVTAAGAGAWHCTAARLMSLILLLFVLLALPLEAFGQNTGDQDIGSDGLSASDALPPTSAEPADGVVPSDPSDADGPTPLSAFPAEAPRPVIDLSSLEERVDDLRSRLQSVQQRVTGNLASLSDTSIDEKIATLDAITAEAALLGQEIDPRLAQFNARLNELTPEEGADEADFPQMVQDEIAAVRETSVKLDGFRRSLQVADLTATELATDLRRIQRDRYIEQFVHREQSILEPSLLFEALRSLPEVVSAFREQMRSTIRMLGDGGLSVLFGLAIALMVFVGIMLGPLRGLVRFGSLRSPTVPPHDGFERVLGALKVFLVFGLIPIAAVVSIIIGLTLGETNADGVEDPFVSGLAISLMFFLLVFGLARAVLARARPEWRLVALGDACVDRLVVVVFTINLLLAFGIGLKTVLSRMVLPLEFVVVATSFGSMLIAVLTALALRVVVSGLSHEDDDEEDREGAPSGFVWRFVVGIYWVLVAVAFFAPLGGYSSLGWFVAIQIGWITIVFALLRLALRFVDEGTSVAFRRDAMMGRLLHSSFGLKHSTVEQLGIISSGVLRLLLLIVGWLSIAAPWGISSRDIFSGLQAAIFGFQIGGLSISLSTLVVAMIVFLLIVFATRSFQSWLDDRLLPRTHLDVGLRTSIRTGFGYLGFVVAVMVAMSYAGFSLQNVALVAGALSVGIGFGLQSIVNNFVSGLILLAERPIKVGDWIVVGSDQGYVKQINVRATEIETFDKAAVIIPNSDLISGTVMNWMHGNPLGRVIVEVPVEYGSDPNEVQDILYKAAEAHPMVVRYPEIFIYFKAYDPRALLFEVRCFITQADYMLNVASELRFDIWSRFQEAGIGMPFPQSDLHLKDMDRIEAIADRFAPPNQPRDGDPQGLSRDAGSAGVTSPSDTKSTPSEKMETTQEPSSSPVPRGGDIA